MEDVPESFIDKKPSVINLTTDKLTSDDALQCLRGEIEVIIPIPNIKPCNNLNEYFARSTSKSNKNLPKKSEPFAVPLERNFDRILKKPSTSSEAIASLTQRPRKQRPDVFSRAEKPDASTSRIPVLSKRLNQDLKVLIRRRRKVPYYSRIIEYRGTLVLFDKHMNLLLSDVVESFTYVSDDKLMKRARFRDNIMIRGDNIILIHL